MYIFVCFIMHTLEDDFLEIGGREIKFTRQNAAGDLICTEV